MDLYDVVRANDVDCLKLFLLKQGADKDKEMAVAVLLCGWHHNSAISNWRFRIGAIYDRARSNLGQGHRLG